MSIYLIKNRLAALQKQVPYEDPLKRIVETYPRLPRGKVPDANAPFTLIFTRESTDEIEVLGDDDYEQTRDYLVWLLIGRTSLGLPGEYETLVEQYIDAYYEWFMARPSLGNLNGVTRAWIASDTGPKQFSWADENYWGIEFRHRIVETIRRPYAENE